MEHSALSVTFDELMVLLAPLAHGAVFLAVAIASYRRSRCLSKYPIWQSVIIAALAGWFWPLWLVFSLMDRKQNAQDWRNYHATRLSPVS